MNRYAIAALLLLSAGCQSAFQRDSAYGAKPAERRMGRAKTFDCVTFSDTLRLTPAGTNADVRADFSSDVQRPADVMLAGFVDATLVAAYRHARGEERKDVGTTGVSGVREAFFDDYRECFADVWEDVSKGDVDKSVARWSCHVEGRIEFCDSRYFSYRVTIDTETGGPHPNRWVQNATYLRQSGRRLMAADVVKTEEMLSVVNLIRRALRTEDRSDKHLRAQLAETIRQPYEAYVDAIRSGKREAWGNPLVTENFLLRREGIVWTYNQYEIACYASGLFDAHVDWVLLKPYLRENLPSLR